MVRTYHGDSLGVELVDSKFGKHTEKERVVKSKCSVWAGRGKREALSVLALFGANRRAASDPDFGWPQQRTTA